MSNVIDLNVKRATNKIFKYADGMVASTAFLSKYGSPYNAIGTGFRVAEALLFKGVSGMVKLDADGTNDTLTVRYVSRMREPWAKPDSPLNVFATLKITGNPTPVTVETIGVPLDIYNAYWSKHGQNGVEILPPVGYIPTLALHELVEFEGYRIVSCMIRDQVFGMTISNDTHTVSLTYDNSVIIEDNNIVVKECGSHDKSE